MKPMPSIGLIAVLLATYNGERYVRQQLLSVLGQTHRNLVVFVRDDGSSDTTLEIVEEVARADSRVRRFLETPRTRIKSAASNFLSMICDLDVSDLDFVAFADQDDIWAPDKLENATKCLRSEGAQGYSSNLLAFNNSDQTAWYVAKHHPQRALDYLFQGASAGCTYVLTSNLVAAFAQKFHPHLETMPGKNSHDWIVYAFARSHGMKWIQDREACIFYRQHSSNAYGDQRGWAAFHRKLRLFRSGWYRDHILWNAKVLAGSPNETAALTRVNRFGLSDRLWLARRSSELRREPNAGRALKVLLLLGLV